MAESPTYIIDGDSTILTVESLDRFGEYVLRDHPDKADICARIEALTAGGMNSGLPFDKSLVARLELIPARKDDIDGFNERLAAYISPSAEKRKGWFEENAKRIYLISGGFEEFMLPIATHLGILATHVRANAFTYDDDDAITGYDTSRLTSQHGGKAAQVHALGLEGRVISVGDGFNDLQIRDEGAADEFWAFTETVTRPEVARRADRVIDSFSGLL